MFFLLITASILSRSLDQPLVPGVFQIRIKAMKEPATGRNWRTIEGVKDQGGEAEASELEDLLEDAIYELSEMELRHCKNLGLAMEFDLVVKNVMEVPTKDPRW